MLSDVIVYVIMTEWSEPAHSCTCLEEMQGTQLRINTCPRMHHANCMQYSSVHLLRRPVMDYQGGAVFCSAEQVPEPDLDICDLQQRLQLDALCIGARGAGVEGIACGQHGAQHRLQAPALTDLAAGLVHALD